MLIASQNAKQSLEDFPTNNNLELNPISGSSFDDVPDNKVYSNKIAVNVDSVLDVNECEEGFDDQV